MILIIESGASKADWCAVAGDGIPVFIKTGGINLATMSEEVNETTVNQALAELEAEDLREKVDRIHFYAAGLVSSEGDDVPELARGLDKVLKAHFPDAVIEYASDLLAAARAVCGHKPGIAAILGTGSNSCLYDGERIVKNIRSGGFILGDEGGGARLGKLFMSDFLKGLVPEPVAEEFAKDFKVDYMTVVANVYRGGAPAGYLGSFAPWIMERYSSSEYVKSLVDGSFRDFFERVLKQYDIQRHPVGVVGGFGYAHREILLKVAETYGVRFSTIIPSPLEGLVRYHCGEEDLVEKGTKMIMEATGIEDFGQARSLLYSCGSVRSAIASLQARTSIA